MVYILNRFIRDFLEIYALSDIFLNSLNLSYVIC